MAEYSRFLLGAVQKYLGHEVPAEGSEIFLLPLARGQTCRKWVLANLVWRDRTHVNKTCSAPNTGSAFEHSWKGLDKPELPAPRKKQGCACVHVTGRAEDKEQDRGGTKLLFCHFCRRKKEQERGRTFWLHLKFGLQVSCSADPMFSCPVSRSEMEPLRIFRESNARAHDGMWIVSILPLCSPSHLIPLCKCSPCLVSSNWSQIKDLWCGQRPLSWFVSCKPVSCDNQALSAAQYLH